MVYLTVAQAETTRKRKRTKPIRRTFGGIFLPLSIGVLMLGAHLTGLALLNWETKKREQLRTQILQLRHENEILRSQLNQLTSEWNVRTWAESAGMVRVEDKNAIIVAGRLQERTGDSLVSSLPLRRDETLFSGLVRQLASRQAEKKNSEVGFYR